MNAAYALPVVRPGAPSVDFVTARRQMLESQIAPSNIIHPAVLAALGAVPRENFVPADLQDRAYADRNLVWEDGFLISPTLCAQLLEQIAPDAPEHVLVIESGAGYLTSLAAQVFSKVTALFPDVGPAKVALNQCNKLGYANITVKSGLLSRGWSRSAPYQAIILAGACATVQEAWVDQLSDGGKIAGLLPSPKAQQLQVMLKIRGAISGRMVSDGAAPFLYGLSPAVRFDF